MTDPVYQDEDALRELYVDEQLSQKQIAERLGCAYSTIHNWLKRHGIERRSISEGQRLRWGSENKVQRQTLASGHQAWNHSYHGEKELVYIHRLLAVAEWGFDAVAENNVHHKNDIPWDNRIENLELMNHGEHVRHHKQKVSGERRRVLAETYDTREISSRDLAAQYGVTSATVLKAHREFYGDKGVAE